MEVGTLPSSESNSFTNTIAEITLNGLTQIDLAVFGGISIFQDINEGLPYGFFQILDNASEYINKFENLQIGATVDIIIKNTINEEETLTLPTFYIFKVEDDFSTNFANLAGTIRVWFVHPWFIFKDVYNHAYNPMNNGKLIKKVLNDSTRGLKFEVDDDNFLVTDDSGKYSRYKVCETDWEFIQNKILPYTTSGLRPVFFYCNLSKKKEDTEFKFKFNLSPFYNLYQKNPKIIFALTNEVASELDNTKEIAKSCEMYNLNHLDIFYLSSISLTIMSEKAVKQTIPIVFTENVKNSKSYALKNTAKNKIADKKSGNENIFENILPIDGMQMNNITGTSVNIIKNKNLIDSLSLILSNSKELDNSFLLIIETSFCGDRLSIGDTVLFFAPEFKEEGSSSGSSNTVEKIEQIEKPKKMWLKDKWLVTKIIHYTDVMENTYSLKTKLHLSRPSFVGDWNTTSLYKGFLHEVI